MTGFAARLNSDNTGIILTNDDGYDIMVGRRFDALNAAAVGVQKMRPGTSGELETVGTAQSIETVSPVSPSYVVSTGYLTLNSEKSYTVVSTGTNVLAPAGSTSNSKLKTVSELDVTTFSKASDAIQTVDFALAFVSGERARLGALQSRFESTISNLQISSENMSAARGRIQDADFATETANLSRAQILQQAGTAMVAQANQLPQGVLALLR